MTGVFCNRVGFENTLVSLPGRMEGVESTCGMSVARHLLPLLPLHVAGKVPAHGLHTAGKDNVQTN